MATFVMLTRLSPDALTRPEKAQELNEAVEERIKRECPNVKWVSNYAVLGPYDYLDIFEAPDNDTATRVALIVPRSDTPRPRRGSPRSGTASGRWQRVWANNRSRGKKIAAAVSSSPRRGTVWNDLSSPVTSSMR